MEALAAVIIVALVVVVVLVVAAPLRRDEDPARRGWGARRADLEAAKEAKYREIRDAEMDWRTGKLSEEDYRALERQLRAEAVVILKALDEEGPPVPPDPSQSVPSEP
jgi:hypothetical protein